MRCTTCGRDLINVHYVEGKPYGSTCYRQAEYVAWRRGEMEREKELMEREKELSERRSRASRFPPGTIVRIVEIPEHLCREGSVNTRALFKRCLGKPFVVQGIGRFGHLELNVSPKDMIWIDAAHVKLALE